MNLTTYRVVAEHELDHLPCGCWAWTWPPTVWLLSMNLTTYRVVTEHELDGIQLDQLADTAVADGQVTEKL